jgi:hypothetical protein
LQRKSGQPRPKTTRTAYISLPKSLVSDIQNLPLSKTDQSHCIKFVGILYRDSLSEHWDLTSPTAKPKNYLVKAFGNRYYTWLKPLIKSGIVLRSEVYSDNNCYTYLVNPKYHLEHTESSKIFSEINQNDILCGEKYLKSFTTKGYKDVVKYSDKDESQYYNWFKNDFLELVIDHDALYQIAISKLKSISLDDYQIDQEVLTPSIEVVFPNGTKRFVNSNEIANYLSSGQQLVLDNRVYKIVEPISFMNSKIATTAFYYRNTIERLIGQTIDAKRNNTNQRLDTNFTNMASELVNEICKQNNLVQIDLSNSQFSILSMVLSKELKSDDYKLFKELTSRGRLYDYIQYKLGLKTTKRAKQLMFAIMFSSYRMSNPIKKKIKELFPTVIDWVDNYKKKHGDNQFSIMLQKIESEIFIDKIYHQVKKRNWFCFTKHDSLIVQKDYVEQVLSLMEHVLEQVGVEYRLKIEDGFTFRYVNFEDKEMPQESSLIPKAHLVDYNSDAWSISINWNQGRLGSQGIST